MPFYPESLCQPPSSPLHFLVTYREWYIDTMADPYYHHDSPGHFFDFLVYVELVVQFPLALYLTYTLLTKRALSGPSELAGSVYGIVTGLCTGVVCHDMWYLGPEIVSVEAKQTLLYAAYLPYAILRKLCLSIQLVIDRAKLMRLNSACHGWGYAPAPPRSSTGLASHEAGLDDWFGHFSAVLCSRGGGFARARHKCCQ